MATMAMHSMACSASLATNASGAQVLNSEQRYLPYGGTRSGFTGSGLPTDRQFTGQRREASLGFYDYVARQYDPALGRFLQADTIVPDPGNPQSLNRYSYTLGNPLRYTDPSGHYTDDEIQKYLQDTYGSDWQSYWDAWQADPYWMWILEQAQDNYVLEIAAGKTIQFRGKAGSFVLSEGKLHEYQGQGAYALYNENKALVEDDSWLGYKSKTGTFGRDAGRSYFQPMYDYSGGKPVFTQWRYITVSYGKPEWRIFSGDNVPYIISGGYAAAIAIGSKFGISLECPPLGAGLAAWSLITAVDNLQVNTADRASYQYVNWTPPPSGPHPASWALQNPNGIGYPAP